MYSLTKFIGKAPIQPIKTKRCLDCLQIDLMDYRSHVDGEFKWILQIKDTFSWHIWLYPLKEKIAKAVYEILVRWFDENGYPNKLVSDNRGEFKGNLIF